MRPDVEWRLPSVVHAGKPFEIGVSLLQKGGTNVELVTLRVFCEKTDGGEADGRELFEQSVLLQRTPTLLPERAEYTVSFTLAHDAPSSSALEGVTWFARVEASIPWWPDLDARTTLYVRGRDPAAKSKSKSGDAIEEGPFRLVPQTPRVLKRVFDGERPEPRPIDLRFPLAGGLDLELSVEDRAYAPGDVVRGRIALGGIAGHDLYTLELHVGRWQRERDYQGNVYYTFVSYAQLLQKLAGFSDGVAIEFEGTISDDAPLGDEAMIRLHLEYDMQSLDERVPIVLGGFAPREEDEASAPVVGNERWREAWRAVATENGFDVDDARFTLRGAVEDVPIAVALHADAVRAELHWAKLGLDLRVERAHGLSFSKPHVGGRSFRDEHRISARDRGQAEQFLRGALIEAIETVRIEAFDDEHGVFADDVTSAHDERRLAQFVGRVTAIASAVHAARDRMPPPTGTDDAARSWLAWAKKNDSAFDVARLSIGPVRREGGSLSLRARFDADGAVDGAVVTLAGERTFAGEISDELRARMPGSPRVEPHALVLELDALPSDPASLEDAFAALDEAASRLAVDGPHGPYR